MSRIIKLSVVLAVVSATVALGAINQNQTVVGNLDNTAFRAGGFGISFGANGGLVTRSQSEFEIGTGFVTQGVGMVGGQLAGTIGVGGASGVNQHMDATSRQNQTAGNPALGSATQGQSLNVNAGQTAFSIGGAAAAGGAQIALVGQRQLIATPGGVSSQGQLVRVGQAALVAGAPGTVVVSQQSLGVRTSQTSN